MHDQFCGLGQSQVEALLQNRIVQIGCGDAFTVAVTDDHELYGWGKAADGRLGDESVDNT